MKEREYWQTIRGICILAVVMIHALGGFNYTAETDTGFIILRQVINFAVATFVFMAGYFVNVDKLMCDDFNYKRWLVDRGGYRLLVPFIVWSLFYSGISILKELHHGSDVNWLGYAYRFVIGKSATPFYYIIVLLQLTIITPWLVKVVKEHGITRKLLWLVTPVYLTYVYVWNFMTGSFPQLYETLFPAWFGFYYLGIHVRCGMKFKCSGKMVAGAWLLSCAEALSLRASGMSMGFYTSQITVGSFLFSASVIGWILEKKFGGQKFLSKVGDCSYGIFYIHMFVLMLVGRFVSFENWFAYWGIRFILTAAISFGIVCLGQRLLKKHGNLLKYIGFI